MIGERFGLLTVIGQAETYQSARGKRERMWLCRCDCGTEKVILQASLRSGNSKSCGCRRGSYTHGMYATPTYSVWANMVSRCTNENEPSFKYYGARGITVFDRWRHFENFLADMGERPDGLTLERVDNDRGYGPDNCEWASRKTQLRNTRRNRMINVDGKEICVAEAAERVGLKPNCIIKRLNRGWSVERALSEPA